MSCKYPVLKKEFQS
jgi:effector-binding domain-containing protein